MQEVRQLVLYRTSLDTIQVLLQLPMVRRFNGKTTTIGGGAFRPIQDQGDSLPKSVGINLRTSCAILATRYQ
eukprot:11095781-Karenia_brevis.AAC.1